MSELITPFRRTKAVVASFPRSGTHFLMNTLALNFGFRAHPFFDFEGIPDQYYGANVALWFEIVHRNEKEHAIVKTHNEVEFFLQVAWNKMEKRQQIVMDIIKDWYHIFYIYRNMDDTMRSYAKHLRDNIQQNTPMAAPLAMTGKELAEKEPWGYPLFHQMYQYPTMRDKWEGHVDGWRKAADEYPITVIRYEDLNDSFDETVKRIGDAIDKHPPKEPVRPSPLVNVVRGAEFVTQ